MTAIAAKSKNTRQSKRRFPSINETATHSADMSRPTMNANKNERVEMKELFAALVKAQGEMEAASKDSANPFFKSRYADLNSVMSAVKPAFTKHGLAFIQRSAHMDNCACVETIIIHESGHEYACGLVSVPVGKHDAQGYGSALTYARRYSLAAAAGVGAEDDDGNAATKSAPKAEPVAGTLTEQAITDCVTAINASKDSDALKKAWLEAIMMARQVGDTESEKSFSWQKDLRKKSFV